MPLDAFLTINGIKGETLDAEFSKKGGMNISNASISFSHRSDINSATGGTSTGRGKLESLNLDKDQDTATTGLLRWTRIGHIASEASIVVRRPGDGNKQVVYWSLQLLGVVLTETSYSFDEGGQGKESLGLRFGAMRFEYQPQDNSGKLLTKVVFSYSFTVNDRVFKLSK